MATAQTTTTTGIFEVLFDRNAGAIVGKRAGWQSAGSFSTREAAEACAARLRADAAYFGQVIVRQIAR